MTYKEYEIELNLCGDGWYCLYRQDSRETWTWAYGYHPTRGAAMDATKAEIDKLVAEAVTEYDGLGRS